MSQSPDNVPKLDPMRRIGEEQKPGGALPGGQGFESYMEKAGSAPGAGKPIGVSPFDLAHGQTMLPSKPSFDTLLSQVKSAHNMLGDMTNSLNTKDLKLKPSQRYLLRNKLKNANTYLRSANGKLGAPIPAEPKETKSGGILGKFLNYISDGQNNLMAAQKQIANLKGKGDTLQPADFLSIQIKMSHAQQEIEYASIMLGKAVDTLKTLMNIQL
jgi:hypothetical protein